MFCGGAGYLSLKIFSAPSVQQTMCYSGSPCPARTQGRSSNPQCDCYHLLMPVWDMRGQLSVPMCGYGLQQPADLRHAEGLLT